MYVPQRYFTNPASLKIFFDFNYNLIIVFISCLRCIAGRSIDVGAAGWGMVRESR